MADVGLSFSPTNQPYGTPTTGSQRSPSQDAIQILRFRLPSILGASAIAPRSLLGGPALQGSMMGGSGTAAEDFIRRLFGGGLVLGAPLPNFTGDLYSQGAGAGGGGGDGSMNDAASP